MSGDGVSRRPDRFSRYRCAGGPGAGPHITSEALIVSRASVPLCPRCNARFHSGGIGADRIDTTPRTGDLR